MVDRSIAPKINKIQSVNFKLPSKHILSNGIPVWEIRTDKQDVIKLDIFFRAGRPYEHKKMVARACSRLLREGTISYNSKEISEALDFHGASLGSPVDLDTSNIVLYCLAKHFEVLIPIFAEIISKPSFQKEELDQFIETNKQRLKVNETKVDVKAYRTITEQIFGKDHPYGYNSSQKGFSDLEISDLEKHFASTHGSQNAEIIISGNTNSKTLDLLEKHLGQIKQSGSADLHIKAESNKVAKVNIKMPDALQSAIRIGFKTFNRSHEDYNGFYVLNTILGGYFGSRLMMNIREDKGYTYNIFSSLDNMVYDGYFYIGTEVGKEHQQKTIKEIYHEMEALKSKRVPEQEMDMVRNYLMGNLLTMFDGPLNQSDVFKGLRIHNADFDSIDKLVSTIQNISSSEIMTLANKYFTPDKYWEVIVGS